MLRATGSRREVLAAIVDMVPDAWLEAIPGDVDRCRAPGRLHGFLHPPPGAARTSLNRRRSMPAPASFDYAILRVVPRVERQEFINAGVVVFCLEKRYLAARIRLDAGASERAVARCRRGRWCASTSTPSRASASGDPSGGPIAKLSQRERFHWLTSPRSTIIQPSPVHTGVCDATDGCWTGCKHNSSPSLPMTRAASARPDHAADAYGISVLALRSATAHQCSRLSMAAMERLCRSG